MAAMTATAAPGAMAAPAAMAALAVMADSCGMLLRGRALELGSRAGVRRRDIGENERRSDAGPGAGIAPPEYGRGRIAGRIQSRDDGAVGAAHTRGLIGHQPAGGADVSGIHRHRIERSLLDRTEIRVGHHRRIAVGTVECTATPTEIEVDARAAEFVEARHGLLESVAVDLADLRKLSDAAGALQIAAVEPRLRNLARRSRAPGVELALPAVHDEPAGYRLARRCVTGIHALPDFHVGTRLVAEALAALVDHHRERQQKIEMVHEGNRHALCIHRTLGQLLAGAQRGDDPPGFVHAIRS